MPDSSAPISMKHNPGFLSAEELTASFLARQAELEVLLEIVRNNTRASNQHVLVIGRRGMGKTMLVHRLALAVETDPELAVRWYPLLFGEEAYGVSSAGEFWLEALHQLGTQTGEARWRDLHVELRREPNERRLHDLALARLLEFADERGVRLMVAVENLQDLLGEQMDDDDGWTLRHTLLNEPRIMLVATATNHFDDIDKPKAAAYGMFRVIQLRPLEQEECRTIWQRLTGERLEGRRIRPIEIFTGGNPRLLTILGGFARGRSLQELMNDLLGLVDDHSDYFKSNLESLSLEERRAFIALCELWEPSPARAVAEVARFDVNKASMCLNRLVNRGAVEVVRTRGRVQYYQVCERLYNLFHRLRRSSTRDHRAASVVEFMLRFYGEDDIPALAKRVAAEVSRDVDGREGPLLALHHLLEKVPSRKEIIGSFPREFWSVPELRRKDLPWRFEWSENYTVDFMTRVDQIWLGHATQFADFDAPVCRLWEQVLASKMSVEECLEQASQYVESASPVALAFCTIICCVKSDDDGYAQVLLDLKWPDGHFILGTLAMAGWNNPQFRVFAERHLLAAIQQCSGESSVVAGKILATHYELDPSTSLFGISVREQVLARWPSAPGYCDLGDLLRMRAPERAEFAYRKALELDPDYRRAVYSLASELKTRPLEAERLALEWLEHHPEDVTMVIFTLQAAAAREDHVDLGARLRTLGEGLSKLDPSFTLMEDWALVLVIFLRLSPSIAVVLARCLERHATQLPEWESNMWVGYIATLLATSTDRAVLDVAKDMATQVPGPATPMHVKFALVGGDAERAFDVLEELKRAQPDTLHDLLTFFRDTLMQLAIANPMRLHAIVAKVPLFEPLTVALAQELGEDVLAPHEVAEVAKDIRAELRRLRGPSYVIEVPVLAAAEDASQSAKRSSMKKKSPAKKKAEAKKKATKRKFG
jgi:hypothetical protein